MIFPSIYNITFVKKMKIGENSIPFNIPYISGEEQQFIHEAIVGRDLKGDGVFTKRCQALIKDLTNARNVLLTSSCTHALELTALLLDIQSGDEVIMPSFTFVSSANAFALRGAKIVYVDIRPDTMNIDETQIEEAITTRTKAILVMHYAGMACEMDTIMSIAKKFQLFVIEDAAQCIDAYYKGRHLGTIGHFGTISFHSTKNIHCGEGGALLINDKQYSNRAEIIREKGTNRKAFLRGEIDKYSWVDIGSSYLMSELNAAFLYAQILKVKIVTARRKKIWLNYYNELNQIRFDVMPDIEEHNAHIFYIKCKDFKERTNLIAFLMEKKIFSSFHYIPLHLSPAGKLFGSFKGVENYTTVESEKLIRLPLYFDLNHYEIVVDSIFQFSKL